MGRGVWIRARIVGRGRVCRARGHARAIGTRHVRGCRRDSLEN